jgi:type IV pilus assembly protein PilV
MVEVLISMLIFSVAVLGLVRVLGVAVRDAGEVEYRAIAATVADETIGRMWVDRDNLGDYAVEDAEVELLPGGLQTVAVDDNVVTVTVTWLPPGAADARVHAVAATIAGN